MMSEGKKCTQESINIFLKSPKQKKKKKGGQKQDFI